MSKCKNPVIMLIEDNPDDVFLVQEAFKEVQLQCHIRSFPDGRSALLALREGPHPDLILLDLNLPLLDGRALLAIIKEDPELMMIPVVVLTTSRSHDDVIGSYRHHCNAYVVKPIEFDEFIDVVSTIKSFWLDSVQFPEKV